MKLDKETKILALINEFPFLVKDLARRNPVFEKLKMPAMRQTVGRIASIEKIAEMGREDILSLLLFLAEKIMAATGQNVEIVPPTPQQCSLSKTKNLVEIIPQRQTASSGTLSDTQRMESLKHIIHDLHGGADMRELQSRFEQTVGDISHQEIAALEQSLVKDGMPETEIKKMCDLHVELLRGPLEKKPRLSLPSGHPVHTYMEENKRADKCLGELSQELDRLAKNPKETALDSVKLKHLLGELDGLLIHYTRKENQLFPMLERHGIDAPPKVMWEIHDDIRAKYRSTLEMTQKQDKMAATQTARDLAAAMRDMIVKEERVLFPLALDTLDEKDWARARQGDDEIGYGFGIVPGNDWQPVDVERVQDSTLKPDSVALSTGVLPLEVVSAMLCNLPVDISFVDANNKVAYYSDSKHRIFPRSPEVIGRDVKNCHPPKSVHIVSEILENFQCGKRDKAEFWLELGGRFIHIQYLALRGAGGQYLGCLEVGQDATYVRSLTGEQRLLEWS